MKIFTSRKRLLKKKKKKGRNVEAKPLLRNPSFNQSQIYLDLVNVGQFNLGK